MSGNYTQTPNLGLFKPVFNADVGNWGAHWNTNADTLDSLLATGSGGTFLPLSGGTVTGATTFSTTLSVAAPGIRFPTMGTNAANFQFAYDGTNLWPYINGIAWGPIASTSYTDGAYLKLTGGTVSGSLIVGSGSGTGLLRIQGAANSTRSLQFTASNIQRWTVDVGGNPPNETGNNTGSNFRLDAFSDTGAFITGALEIQRGSGPLNTGGPYIVNLAPFRQARTNAAVPNGVIGNLMTLPLTADRQPVVTLGANPISVTNGSPTVTVTWAGACVAGGQVQTAIETWVNLQGITAVGGITPVGWLKVVSIVDANTFTVTWTSNATSTATGGGSAVTIQPSFTTTTNWLVSGITTGGNGFPGQTAQLLCINPDFYQPLGGATYSRYQQNWKWVVGPNDTSGTNAWNVAAMEWDLSNRGKDPGYSPNITGATNATMGFWMGPKAVIPSWATGGGVGTHWNTVIGIFSDTLASGVYDALNIQPNALVGAAMDPTGHGGVGVDVFGSYTVLNNFNPFSTTAGTSTITVSTSGNAMAGSSNGDTVWMPNVFTISGVTFGGASYVMSNVNSPVNTFTITGTGTAAATVTGGGSGQWAARAKAVPFAPYQIWGSFKHGLISTNARFESGGIVETQPGNGVLWSDGTGAASINSSVISPGNLNLDLWPAGSGNIVLHGPMTGPGITRTITTGAPASVTGVTTETNLAALRIPAGTMGINGVLVVLALFAYPNNANNKTFLARFTNTAGSVSGSPIGTFIATTTVSAQLMWVVRNTNAANAQSTFVSPNVPFGAAGSSANLTTTNTANDAWININGTLANAADTITLTHAVITVYPSIP